MLRDAAFLTTSSEAIAAAYREQYGVRPSVVHNTFPLPAQLPDFTRADPGTLRLYWFSQTIGPGRGLEDAVAALGRAGVPAELDAARPRRSDGYLDALTTPGGGARAAARGRLIIRRHRPTRWSISRAATTSASRWSRRPRATAQLCLTNKAFTYILAGRRGGHHATRRASTTLGVDLGRAAALVPPGDVDALAARVCAVGCGSRRARLREADGVAGGGAAMALGARVRTRHAVPARQRGAGVRILLVMDPYIKVPPDHYGGIERVIADLADGLARSGHDVTLWAAPGSRVNGRVERVRTGRGVDAVEQRS